VNYNINATYDSGIWDSDNAPDALEGESTPMHESIAVIKIHEG